MKTNLLKTCLLAVIIALFTWACSDNDDDFDGVDNFITGFSLLSGEMTYSGAIVNDTVFMIVPFEADLKGASASYAMSENATITPDPKAITDWNADQKLTVTSKNGKARTYYVKSQRIPGPDSYIIGFNLKISENSYSGAIVNNTITFTIPANADLTQATGSVTYSENVSAVITPDPATYNAWKESQEFKVTTNKNPEGRVYTVLIKQEAVTYSGDAILLTQQDVENFAALGYTTIDGNLMIGATTGTDSIRDLSALAGLTEITQCVYIRNTFAGESLDGLQNLTRIGGFYAGGRMEPNNVNFVKTKLETPRFGEIHFPKLVFVASQFCIYTNKIHTLELPTLESVGSELIVESDSLKAFDLSAIQRIGGVLSILNAAFVEGILDLKLLQNCEKVEIAKCTFEAIDLSGLTTAEIIDINNCKNLESLKVTKLERTREVSLSTNQLLTSIDFTTLTGIEEKATFSSCPMTDEVLFPNLAVMGSWYVDNFPLKEIPIAFPSLKELRGTTSIGNNVVTELDLTGLSVNGDLTMQSLGLQTLKVKSISGNLALSVGSFNVEELTTIGGALKVGASYTAELNIPTLRSIGGLFQNSSNTQDGCTLNALESIGGNLQLTAKCPSYSLSNLKTVKGNVTLQGGMLTSIDLTSLTSVEGTFTLQSAPKLTTIQPMNDFNSVKSIKINNCSLLEDFSAFGPIANTLTDNSQWTVTNCKYKPTLNQMKAGDYSPNN